MRLSISFSSFIAFWQLESFAPKSFKENSWGTRGTEDFGKFSRVRRRDVFSYKYRYIYIYVYN